MLATLDEPLEVSVTQGGVPVPGVPVRWSLEDQGETSGVTDASGRVAVWWTLGSRSGRKNAQAWVPGVENEGGRRGSVEFTATATPGAPAGLRGPDREFVADLVGELNSPVPVDYWVWASDAYGNLVRDVTVKWNVTAGGGSIVPLARERWWHGARHTLGPAEGLNQVTATLPGSSADPQLTFTATGIPKLVEVRDGGFARDSVSVPVGTSVGWLWGLDYVLCDDEYDWCGYGPAAHDVVFQDDPAPPASSVQQGYGTHLRTFTTPGTYRYRCTLHSSGFVSGHMGMVVVEGS